MTTNQQNCWIIQLSLVMRVVFPVCWKKPLGSGGKLTEPRKQEGPFPSRFKLWNEVWPQKSKHLSKSQIGNESRKQNKAHCWFGLHPLADPQFIPLELPLPSLLLFMFFKCQSSRTLPLTFQHLISQNTAPYLWQLQHVHLIEIEQNKSLSALNYVHGKYKILCVRLLQFLFVVLALY